MVQKCLSNLFQQKKDKTLDKNAIVLIKENINNIIEGKKPNNKLEDIIGEEKLSKLLEKSIEYSKEQSLQSEIDKYAGVEFQFLNTKTLLH